MKITGKKYSFINSFTKIPKTSYCLELKSENPSENDVVRLFYDLIERTNRQFNEDNYNPPSNKGNFWSFFSWHRRPDSTVDSALGDRLSVNRSRYADNTKASGIYFECNDERERLIADYFESIYTPIKDFLIHHGVTAIPETFAAFKAPLKLLDNTASEHIYEAAEKSDSSLKVGPIK